MTLATLVAMIAGLGTLQRVWQHRVLVALEKAADDANPQLQEARRLKEQLDRLHDEIARLPPESRTLVQDVLTSRNGETVANPLILSLARFDSERSEKTVEERIVAGARAAQAAWARAQGFISSGWWLLCGVLIAAGTFAAVVGSPSLLTWASRAAAGLPLAWFLGLSVASAAVFAATGRNPWPRLAFGFYAPQCVLLFAGLMLRLQEGRQPDDALADALFGLAAPACSAAVLAALAVLG